MESRSVTLEITKGGGQPRPYADHEYEGYLIFSVPWGQMYASKFGHTEKVAKDYLRLFVTNFKEKGEAAWYEAWLEKLTQVAPGRWHYIIKSHYLD